jgi:hypothetical protein
MSGHGIRRFRGKKTKHATGGCKPGANKEAVKMAMDCAWSEEGVTAKKARSMSKKGKKKKG